VGKSTGLEKEKTVYLSFRAVAMERGELAVGGRKPHRVGHQVTGREDLTEERGFAQVFAV